MGDQTERYTNPTTRHRTMNDEKRPLLTVGRTSMRDERPLRVRRLACITILLSELLERLAFYSISFNIVIYLTETPYNWTPINSANANFAFQAIAFGFCIIPGYLADKKFGRFKTILIFYTFLLVGYVMLVFLNPLNPLACMCPLPVNSSGVDWTPLIPAEHRMGNLTPFVDPNDMDKSKDPPCKGAVYLTLAILGIGTAAFRTNIAPFGADQVRSEGPESMRMFFNWLYWSVNVGSLLAIFGVTYIQQKIGFFIGFIVVLGIIVLALFIFLSGTKCYIRRPAPGTDVLYNVVRVVYNAIKTRHRRSGDIFDVDDKCEESPTTSSCPVLPECPSSERRRLKGFLEYAKTRNGGQFHDHIVEDVKVFFKMLLIFTSIIPYWTVYFQMSTNYLLQGLHMKVGFGACNATIPYIEPDEFSTPPAWLSAFDVVCTIIFIPIVDRLLYKALDRIGYPLSLRNRMAIGMCFATLSVLIAGVLERHRLNVYWKNGVENPCIQLIGHTPYYAADVSIFYQVPQYALIGISEIFTSIAGMELAYTAAPRSMQAITMGMFLLFSGIGCVLGSITMMSFKDKWFFDWDNGNINCRFACSYDVQKVCAECHLDYYFYFLAGFECLGLVLFLVLSHCLNIGYSCPGSTRDMSRSVNYKRAESNPHIPD